MQIRKYRPEDGAELASLFYATVHSVNKADYSPEQLEVWAPRNIEWQEWCRPFDNSFTLVAEQEGEILGFGNLLPGGMLDRLYVKAENQGKGVATALADGLEQEAKNQQQSQVTVDASITAKKFFLHRGYETLRKNTVIRQGVALINYRMVKLLQ